MEQIGRAAVRGLEEVPPGRSRARGRQDRDGQEKVIDKTHLTEKLPYLIELHGRAKGATNEG